MPTWVYEARDRAGKSVKGTREAADRQSAIETLRAEGFFLTRLEAASSRQKPAPVAAARPAASNGQPRVEPPPRPLPARPRPISTAANPAHQLPSAAAAPLAPRPFLRASSKDLSLFFRQMGAMIHAGTTIGAALHSLSSNATSSALGQAAREMQPRVMSGEPLSECLTAFPGLFTPLHVGLVKAGERGGFLDRMFARLAQYSERDYDLQQTIKRETWYPKMLVFASILIPGIVPAVLAGVQGTGSPVAAWLHANLPPLLLIAAVIYGYRALYFAAPLATRGAKVRSFIDNFKMRVPVGGKIVRALAITKFCRALGALYTAGVSPGESVRLAASACGNDAIGQSALRIIPRLEHGESLTACLGSTGHFPDIAMQMMSVGEESGSLDDQLDKAADFLEGDAETAVKQGVQALGVLVFLIIAISIGMQVAKFWGSYFNNTFDMVDNIMS